MRVVVITSAPPFTTARPARGTVEPVTTPVPAPLHWRQADDDLWVATLGGEFAGTIAREPDGHHVADRLSRPVAVRRTWQQAADSLATSSCRDVPAARPAPGTTARTHHRPRSPRGSRSRTCGCAYRMKEDTMTTGTVKWFNAEKGYGFIAPSDGSADVFAHYSAIASSGYRSLEENQQVEFDVTAGPKGPQAENIRPL